MKKNKLLNLALLTGAAVSSIYAFNKIVSKIANSDSQLANSLGLRYDLRFGSIFYTVHGSKYQKPLLLIHDLDYRSCSDEWKFITENLSSQYCVYTLDLIGCGRSSKPDFTYTNYLYVQLITDFVKNVIGQRTNVVASGRSAAFVSMALNNDNTLFDRLMYINPCSPLIKKDAFSKKNLLKKKFLELPLLGTFAYNLANTLVRTGKTFNRYYCHNGGMVKTRMVKTFYDAAHHGNSTGKYLMASILSGYTDIDSRQSVRNISNSLTLVVSEFDGAANENAALYTELNPSIETVRIKNTAHLPQLEHGGEVISLIKTYL